MKRPPLSSALALSLSALLCACGGGGNESGPPDRIYASATDIKVGGVGQCFVGLGPEVHVYGGTPPYTLANSVPQGMQLNKTVLQNSGDSFVITFINGVCLKTLPITIEDRTGLITQVLVTNGE